jgi:hypothetical protein
MKKYFIFTGVLCFIISTGFTQTDISKPVVQKAIYFDVSPPLRDMIKTVPEKADNSWKVIKNYFNARKNNRETFSADWVDPLIQHKYQISTPAQDSTIQNFLGNTNTQGYDPPDTYGQVGPNHYFALVNCHFSIYDKTGTKLLGPTSTMTLWNGMPHNMNGGDGVVLYDADADRWLIAQLAYPAGYDLEMVAVSQTNDPTGSWYRWEYIFDCLPDYPKIGVWPDGYYMSVNRFGSSGYIGTGQAVFNRTKMLAGDPTAEMVYLTLSSSDPAYSLLPSSCDGTFPPSGTPNYFVYMNDGPDYLGVYEFHVDWTNPGNSTFGNYLQLPVTTFNDNLSGIPQKGTTRQAGTLSDRLMYRLQFRAFSDHWSMVCNHTVNVGSGVAGIRWYELEKPPSGLWAIHQQSTYSPSDGNCRWMGSAAMDTAGNIAIGFSISSANMYPAIKFTGRLKNDSLNAMTIPEKGIYYGTGSNDVNDGGGTCRWGDYSTLTVDPSDGMTFWYSQQYLTSMGSNWKTRIASFIFLFTVHATATPDTICIGDSIQLNALTYGGTGTYTYSWTSLPAGFTSTIKNPVASPIITTKYIVAVTDTNTTKTDTIQVVVNGEPTANAGPNASYPNTTPSFPVSGTATNYSSVKWLTAGDGYFTSDSTLNSIYYTGPNDRNYGGALLTILANPIRSCSDTTSDTVFIRLTFPVGVVHDASVGFDVSILPNPTNGLFNLVVRGSMDMELRVTISDMSGKTIFMDRDKPLTQEYSRAVDLTGFPNGVYFIKAQNDVHLITKKLVIQ